VADTKKPDPESGADASPDTAPPEGTAPPSQEDEGAPIGADTTVAPLAQSAPAAPGNAAMGGLIPALVGGVLAAFLLLVAARSGLMDTILPGVSGKSETVEALATLRDTDEKQTGALATLRAEFDALDLPDLAPLTAQQTALQGEVTRLRADMDTQQAYLRDLESRIDPLAARIEALEMRPMTDNASQEAIAAYDRELAALQQAMATQRADVEAMIADARATEDAARALEEDAASAARNAQNQATFARLLGALDKGAIYAPILDELAAAGVAVPPALTASANDGVATLAALGDAFPAAARAALSAARSEAGDSGGLGGFLQRQLGARSVQPRQGDDPDAVLSRAEAAVSAGDLAKALKEIATLPDAARADMQTWTDTATTRLKTLQAADELAQSLNTN
jgi:hypothetical protein